MKLVPWTSLNKTWYDHQESLHLLYFYPGLAPNPRYPWNRTKMFHVNIFSQASPSETVVLKITISPDVDCDRARPSSPIMAIPLPNVYFLPRPLKIPLL
jgi:hypothetical protein